MSTPNELLAASACYRCIPPGKQIGVLLGMLNQFGSLLTLTDPRQISSLVAWYRLEGIDNGSFADAAPIPTWPPYFGTQSLIAYDPFATGVSPLFEVGAGPGGRNNANLATGGAFSFANPPVAPVEVFLVGFYDPVNQGTVQATPVDGDTLTFTAFSSTAPPGFFFINSSFNSQSNLTSSAVNSVWTTFDFCIGGANSHIEVAGNVGSLVPADSGPASPTDPLVIGNIQGFDFITGPQYRWGGAVVEVLIFNAALTATQRSGLRAYFLNKYPTLL